MNAKEIVLIFQIGSLGDTVISLPCYREIARRHPGSKRYLLTNYPIGSKMTAPQTILLPTGMIVGSIEYSMPLRKFGEMIELRRRIAALGPSALYYLLSEDSIANLLRHYAFFKLCGIRKIHGMPWSRDLRFPREIAPGTLWESEASRLLRAIGAEGPPPDADRDLCLSDAERAKADVIARQLGAAAGFLAISVGGKFPVKDWGDGNWTRALRELSWREPGLGAVFVGSDDERSRNDSLANHWDGPHMNTCGRLTPRETAALIARAAAFLGHDTGTLHLAAAVGTPVVGIYSARDRPGKWFSDRAGDTFFYNRVPCFGCELEKIEDCPRDHLCMASHDPAAIVAAVGRVLSAPGDVPRIPVD